MLKSYFDIYAVTEEQLTGKAIGRLRFASFVSIFFFPAVTVLQEGQIPAAMFNILAVFTGFALLCFAYVAMSRAGNRLWVPNKYLDEGEIQRKQVAGYLTYKWIMLSLFAVMLILVISIKFINISPPKMSMEIVLYYTIGNFIICAMSLQTFFATQFMQPLEQDGVSDVPVKSGADKWYKYFACGFVFIFLIVPLIGIPFIEGFNAGFNR